MKIEELEVQQATGPAAALEGRAVDAEQKLVQCAAARDSRAGHLARDKMAGGRALLGSNQ